MHDPPPGTVASAVKTCAADLKELEKERAASEAGLDDLAKALSEANPQPTDKNQLAKVAAKAIIDESAQQLHWAKDLGEQAQKALAAAEAVSNPAVARIYLKDAELKAEGARNIVQRVQSGLGMTTRDAPPNAVAGGSGGGLDPGGGRALYQPKVAAGIADKTFGASPVYDAAFSYDPVNVQVRDARGRVVDVRPIVKAVQGAMGTRVEVFEPVRAAGMPPTWWLTDSAHAALSSSESPKHLENVGGVELQVTLDLPGLLGLPDFRKPGPTTIVGNPVLISLKEIANQASQYATPSAWGDLPEELRYPGAVERIHGFIFDPGGRDISASNLAASARRSASSVRVASSNSIREKLFPSASSKTAYLACPFPQESSIGGSGKRTPRLDHSSNKLRTSSVRKLNPVLWPIRWCSADPSGGTTRAIPGRPVPAVPGSQPAAGGATTIHRPPRELHVHNRLEI